MKQSNSDNGGKFKRRGVLKGIAATGISASAVTQLPGVTNAATGVADGEDVYLIFGVDTSSTDLDSWLKDHKHDVHSTSQKSSSEVIQYQDVNQLNVNQHGAAVAISIDGGDANAIQRAQQANNNTQDGSAQSINVDDQDKQHTFKNVGNVYIVFAGETDSREFSGWVVGGDEYKSKQFAEADIDQTQKVEQVNYSKQSTAIAIAEDGSYSRAYQRSFQRNQNVQSAKAAAINTGDGDKQSANSSVWQYQDVNQLNVNKQGVAVAIAVGEDSTAKAWQVSCQFNKNAQIAQAKALNFDSKSVDEFMASAKMTGDYSDSDVTRSRDGAKQSNEQSAESNVDQFQDVSQKNINMQNAAIAVALDHSKASATQASYQGNFNAQIARALSRNIDVGHYQVYGVIKGTDTKGDGSWAVAYDNGKSQQTATSDITQYQYVEQLNVNVQNNSIAYANHDGCATAEQLNFQQNKNVQYAESTASNTTKQKHKKKQKC